HGVAFFLFSSLWLCDSWQRLCALIETLARKPGAGKLYAVKIRKRKGELMSEDNAEHLDADSTIPAPFEDFVRQGLALLVKQGNELREGQVKLQKEMVERFLQLSRQIKDLDQKVKFSSENRLTSRMMFANCAK